MLLAGLALLLAPDILVSSLVGHPITGAAEAAFAAVLPSLAQFMLLVFVIRVAVALVAYLAARRNRTPVHR